jgi:hypothetical protein
MYLRQRVVGFAACACGTKLGVALEMVPRPFLTAPRRFLNKTRQQPSHQPPNVSLFGSTPPPKPSVKVAMKV